MTEHNHSHILTVNQLSKRFGEAQILKDIKLSLGLGEIYAIIGPNGAGKTTLFNVITGIIPSDRGRVTYYNGHNGDGKTTTEITGMKPHNIARLGIGRTFQGNRIFSNMTVLENVMTAKQLTSIENPLSIIKPSYPKILKKLIVANGHISGTKEVHQLEDFLKEEALYWLDFVGLADKPDNKAEELSYGQQKLLSIARLLMADCRLLMFDEPTAGVNPEYTARIAEVFKKITAKREKTILFIEHDMDFIQTLHCKCLYLENGRCPWPFYSLEVIIRNPDIRRKFMGM